MVECWLLVARMREEEEEVLVDVKLCRGACRVPPVLFSSSHTVVTLLDISRSLLYSTTSASVVAACVVV